MNKEDEISLAQFFYNLKVVPLLDPFSTFLSASRSSFMYSRSRSTCTSLQNYGELGSAKSNDVNGLSGAKGRRRRVRLTVTRDGSHDDY
jgi:hypothetical protein